MIEIKANVTITSSSRKRIKKGSISIQIKNGVLIRYSSICVSPNMTSAEEDVHSEILYDDSLVSNNLTVYIATNILRQQLLNFYGKKMTIKRILTLFFFLNKFLPYSLFSISI